jgi:prepilin-type processing-associated H-X9-DG protein
MPIHLAELTAPASMITVVDMRPIGGYSGWTGQMGAWPFKQTIRPGLYGRELLSGTEVLGALDQAEQGRSPSGEGAKFAPRVGTKRHTDGENYIFADGHAKWMKFRQTLGPGGGTDGSMWVQPLLRAF